MRFAPALHKQIMRRVLRLNNEVGLLLLLCEGCDGRGARKSPLNYLSVRKVNNNTRSHEQRRALSSYLQRLLFSFNRVGVFI